MKYLSANLKTIGLAPAANAFAGTVRSDVVKAWGDRVVFTIIKGVGTTGTATITVSACPDTDPSARTAIPFMYRECTTMDTWGVWTAATTAGFTTTAGSNQLYEIAADPAEAAEEGYEYVELTSTEATADPVLGGILIEVIETRYQPSGTLIT